MRLQKNQIICFDFELRRENFRSNKQHQNLPFYPRVYADCKSRIVPIDCLAHYVVREQLYYANVSMLVKNVMINQI